MCTRNVCSIQKREINKTFFILKMVIYALAVNYLIRLTHLRTYYPRRFDDDNNDCKTKIIEKKTI